MFKNILSLVLIFVLQIQFWGQQLNTSPFSRYGVGEINDILASPYLGFSNTAVAFSDPQFINVSNPASYSRMRENTIHYLTFPFLARRQITALTIMVI